MKINGDTQIIGFLGNTYQKSKMYDLYNNSFNKLKLNYIYLPFVVKDLQKAIEGIKNLSIKAVGVTIPYKITIIKYLDELDEEATKIGAVNLILNNQGKLLGKNTDGKGAIRALKEKTEVSGKRILLLGAGGAARAIAFAIKREGGSLMIVNRNKKSGEDLANTVGFEFYPLESLNKIVKTADIIINATPVGMSPGTNSSLISGNLLNEQQTVMELVTAPKETLLIKYAKAKNCQIVYGERMLLHQAALKFKIITGAEPPLKIMEESLN